MRHGLAIAGLVLAAAFAAAPEAHAHGSEGHGKEAAHAAGPPLFEPPAPGSYELPAFGSVAEHVLLDEAGQPHGVPDLAPGQVAVVAFIYASCGQSCPMALATLQQLDRAIAERKDLREHVRLLTVSFDPKRDSPARMRALREGLAPRTDWRFLTSASPEALAPVLEDYGQRVVSLLDVDGAETGVLEHVLKVYLLDERRRVRNVYSVGLMDPRLVLADIRTVLLDRPERQTVKLD